MLTTETGRKSARLGGSVLRLLIVLPAAIFLANLGILLFLHHAITPHSDLLESAWGSVALVLILFPVAYFLVFRPMVFEISERCRAEEALQRAHDALETRVAERTEELACADRDLQAEVAKLKQAEEALKETNQTLQALIQASPLAILTSDADGNITMWNKAAERIFDWTEDEVLGRPNPIVPMDKWKEFSTWHERAVHGEALAGLEARRQRKDGSLVDVSISTAPLGDAKGEAIGAVALIADISDRRRAEEERQLTYEMQTILAGMLRVSLMDVPLEEQLELILNRIISISWLSLESKGCIFLVEDEPDVLVMQANHGQSQQLLTMCERVPFGRCLCGRAAQSGSVVFADHIDDRHENLPSATLPHGHYCVPILSSGKTLGVINLYVREGHSHDKRDEGFLCSVADVLAGIVERKRADSALRKAHDELELRVEERTAQLASANQELTIEVAERERAEKEVKQGFERLQRTLDETIHAMAMTVEVRDPYTAGHQRRVADLAYEIGKEMGLPEHQLNGIRMAASIHDIGKINAPAEILSKPGRLTEFEFGLIKIHPQVGYEILNTIEFPWPIAEIVYQHHERMDGSGYPLGLSGEEILLEARIVAVADVVEAMASHRPYRPSLGVEKALEEIAAKRGVLYDPAVVDACLKLFVKDGFVLAVAPSAV